MHCRDENNTGHFWFDSITGHAEQSRNILFTYATDIAIIYLAWIGCLAAQGFFIFVLEELLVDTVIDKIPGQGFVERFGTVDKEVGIQA